MGVEAELQFQRNAVGKVTQVVLHQAGQEILAVRE
jgi:hypothetical protein